MSDNFNQICCSSCDLILFFHGSSTELRAGEIVHEKIHRGALAGKKGSTPPMRRLTEFAKCPPALSLGSNTGTTGGMMMGIESTKNSMDRAMCILMTLISPLDKLEEVWLRQRTICVSLTTVMMIAINTMIRKPVVRQNPWNTQFKTLITAS